MGDVGTGSAGRPDGGRTALERRALDLDTSMSELVRNAISSGCGTPTALATASIGHRGESGSEPQTKPQLNEPRLRQHPKRESRRVCER
jgi:hypothetical protein